MPGSADSASAGRPESDVAADRHLAGSRETGGADPDRRSPDERDADPDGTGTTGTDRNDSFVGRVAGQDAGYAGTTGAEARSDQASGRDQDN